MILTIDEYRQGVLYWNPEGNAVATTATSETQEGPVIWSAPLVDPRGSKVPSPPYNYFRPAFAPIDGSAPFNPYPVRWEHQYRNVTVTKVWEKSLSEPPSIILHVPNYGKFHRLVVGTASLKFPAESIIRAGDVVIRGVEGPIQGETAPAFDQVEIADGVVEVTGAPQTTAEVNLRFVEVVAPGESLESAQERAYSLLGLVALVTGDQAVGDIVFSETYEVSPGRQVCTLQLPFEAQIPRESELLESEILENAIPRSELDWAKGKPAALALRWYERGIQATASLDKFLSHFIGIETIASSYSSRNGPIPCITDREDRLLPILGRLQPEATAADVESIKNHVGRPSLAERFAFYVERRELDSCLIPEFKQLIQLRNDAVHGNSYKVGESEASRAKRLLITILRTELGMQGEMAWERMPSILSVKLAFEYGFTGYHHPWGE